MKKLLKVGVATTMAALFVGASVYTLSTLFPGDSLAKFRGRNFAAIGVALEGSHKGYIYNENIKVRKGDVVLSSFSCRNYNHLKEMRVYLNGELKDEVHFDSERVGSVGGGFRGSPFAYYGNSPECGPINNIHVGENNLAIMTVSGNGEIEKGLSKIIVEDN